MSNKSISIIIALSFLTVACTATGPADDGFENSNESVDIGRLLTDDGEAYTIYNSDDKKSDTPSTDAKTITDFEAYEQWKQAKERIPPNTRKSNNGRNSRNFNAGNSSRNNSGQILALAKLRHAGTH